MRTRWLPVLGLAVLAPVCAEYLWAYDESTGDAAVLVGSLVVFSPLYGCPALLIREVARRRGLGWPGILLLAAAFGIVQAGLVDQSMFSRDYRDIPYWSEMADPTYVEPIGLSIYLAVLFVGGHVVNSIGAPIALAEAITGRRGREPWLGRPGIVVVTLLYLAASGLVLQDMLATEDDYASPGQLVGAAVAVVLLVVAAFVVGRRRVPLRAGRAPRPWLVGAGAFAAMGGTQLLPPSPLGTDGVLVIGATAVVVVWQLSRRPGWSVPHTAALAGGALIAAGLLAFASDPLGDVTATAQLGHNVVLLVAVCGLTLLAVHRSRPAGAPGPGRASVAG